MIALGNAKTGNVVRVSQRAARMAREHGQIAVLLAQSGEAYAVQHYAPAYAEALQAGPHLCGVYRLDERSEPEAPSPCYPEGLAKAVREDMLQSWQEIRR